MNAIILTKNCKKFISKLDLTSQRAVEAKIVSMSMFAHEKACQILWVKGSKNLRYLKFRANKKQIRIFCFYHESDLILLNGFIKRTDKTPSTEIQKAEALKSGYLAGPP